VNSTEQLSGNTIADEEKLPVGKPQCEIWIMLEPSVNFLKNICKVPSPSGYEQRLAQIYRDYVGPFADTVSADVHGNFVAAINPDARMKIMLAGHMDEIGFIIHYIDEKGFVFFGRSAAMTVPCQSVNGSGCTAAVRSPVSSGRKPCIS
jgi:hypothetical protein